MYVTYMRSAPWDVSPCCPGKLVPASEARRPAGTSWRDYRDLLVRAHIQLGGPIVVVWDCENDGVSFEPRSGSVWD